MDKKQAKELKDQMDRIEKKFDELNSKLDKHIEFIDEVYSGLRNPIKAASRLFECLLYTSDAADE